jgi:hypothetical protein
MSRKLKAGRQMEVRILDRWRSRSNRSRQKEIRSRQVEVRKEQQG